MFFSTQKYPNLVIYQKVYSINGKKLKEMQVNYLIENDQLFPEVAMTSVGKTIVTWVNNNIIIIYAKKIRILWTS